jgi:negative regulator of sigma-B (phosphoserine phosphatase)
MDAVSISQGELIEWGVAARALPGESRSGDRHLVEPFSDGVLVAVVDGLGHGDEAADAAEAATDILIRYAQESPVSLVRRCHESLWGTRGVAMSVAAFARSSHTMSWLGVGNVEGSLFRDCPGSRPARDSLIQRGGVVGFRLPPLQPSVVTVGQGDLLVLATDGIAAYSLDGLRMTEPPERIASDILARFARDTDDALVLVARCRGEASWTQ